VSLSEQALVGYSLISLKIFNCLPVRLFVQIPVKAVSPTKALYSNRQVSNDNFLGKLTFKNTHSRIYNNGMKRNYTPIGLLAPVTKVSITHTRSEATHSPVRTETIYCDRPDGSWIEKGFRSLFLYPQLIFGGKGANPLFLLYSFSSLSQEVDY
jgi:hypothetical protein